MCGRLTRSKDYFSQHADQRAFLDQLGLAFSEPVRPRYNVATASTKAASKLAMPKPAKKAKRKKGG